jgi:hypothetical protein
VRHTATIGDEIKRALATYDSADEVGKDALASAYYLEYFKYEQIVEGLKKRGEFKKR